MAARFLQHDSDSGNEMPQMSGLDPEPGPSSSSSRAPQVIVYKPRVGYRSWQTPAVADADTGHSPEPKKAAPAQPRKPARADCSPAMPGFTPAQSAKAAALTLAASAAAVKAAQAAAAALARQAHGAHPDLPHEAETPPAKQAPHSEKDLSVQKAEPGRKPSMRRIGAKSPESGLSQGTGSGVEAPKPKAAAKSKAKDKAKKEEDGNPTANTASRKRAPRGSCGTFAGHRPPKNPEKRAVFEELKAEYLKAQQMVRSMVTEKDGKVKRRRLSDNQLAYYAFMKDKMSDLAADGMAGSERMKAAAAAWQEKVAQAESDADEPAAGK